MKLRRVFSGLLLLMLVVMVFMFSTPAPIFAVQTISIAPTQPVYLVDNGDTANVGYKVTFTGDPAGGLDRDITLALTTGTSLQVGGSPGNAQNVTTELAGTKTTLAAASTTLAQGKGFLWAAASAGDTNIKVNNVTNIFVGQALNIGNAPAVETVTVTEVGTVGQNGTGISFTPALASNHGFFNVYAGVTPAGSTNIRVASLANFAAGQVINVGSGTAQEQASVVEVGNGGATLLSTAAAAGDSNIKVESIAGLVAGNKIWIGMGATQESAVIDSVGTEGESGTGVNLTAALANNHASAEPVTGNILVLAAPLSNSHFATSFFGADPAVVGVTPAGTTNLKVVSVTGFFVGQEVAVDTGANQEIVTIASVGTPGVNGTGLGLTAPLTLTHSGSVPVVQTAPAANPGDTNVKVESVMGFYPGDRITIGSGASAESHTILSVGTPGLAGTGIDIEDPLVNSHPASAQASDTRMLPSTAQLGTDYTVPSNSVVIPAGSPSGTEVTIPVVTLANPNPSLALTINTKAECTAGCEGVTVDNNDPSTVVINAHGFPYLDPSLPIDERVDDLLSRMSLFEKVGQMTQTLMSVVNNGSTTNESTYNNIRAWRLGSILSGGSDNPVPNSPTGWADMIDAFQYRALATPLQIPYIYGEDTIHGNAHMVGAVMFPHNIGMGATRNPELSYLQGVITAQETRSAGPHWGFGPAVCAARDIRWGRTYECYSEDPDLVILMETILEGYQGSDPDDMTGMQILSTPKHFAGDGATVNGQNTGNVVMTSQEFEYVALSPYVPAVQQYHAATIMPSYSSTQLDGAPTSTLMSANADLMTGWLKEDIGFEGFLISDWNAINSIPVPNPNPLPSPINLSYAYQIMISFNAGMDMVMSPNQPAWKNFINNLQTLVDTGYVSQDRIDDAVERILRQKFALGLFEQPFTDRSTQDQIYSDAHRAVARQSAAESQVLLKNENGILPISKTANIYLAGSNAHNIVSQAGGWSIGWQSIPGNMVSSVDPYFTTIYEAIQAAVGDTNVTYSANAASPAPGEGSYDVGIVVVGEGAYAEGSGDVPGAQSNATTAADAAAITEVCNAMPCIIMTISGRPFMLSDSEFDQASAVVASWYPGSEGEGVADVLFGDADFTGRLSMTWPWTNSQEPINVGDADYVPRYPYGWGLRTGSTYARLQQTRDVLAASGGDAHVAAAVAILDELLAADVWTAGGLARDPGAVLRALQSAADELAATGAEPFAGADGVVSAARDVAQANIVRDGGPDAFYSPLIADADHELLIGQPDVAVMLLTQASGDVTPPDLAPTVSPNPVLLHGLATATPNATDDSGIASASCEPVDTSSVGLKSLTCTAVDVFGNTAFADVDYNVIYDFSGFGEPISDPPAVNTANSVRSIPLKWRISDVNGDPVTDLADVVLAVEGFSCSLGTTPDLPYEKIVGGLQNQGDGYYQVNWKTPKSYANSCKTLKLDLGEGPGMERIALFQFTK